MTQFTKPCEGYVTSLFSDARLNPVLNFIRPHTGVDYGSDANNTIRAAASGTVTLAETNEERNGYGRYIIIRHADGKHTLYAHLQTVSVKAGQSVSQGQSIGVKGSTGNSTGVHLHFEIRTGSSSSSAVDPLLYIVDPYVKDLQRLLNAEGFKLVVDGVYGAGTAKAVHDFQKKHKLVADGAAGRVTMNLLQKRNPSKPSKPKDEEVEKVPERNNAPASPSHKANWDRATKLKLFNGEYPKENLTREQAATVLMRMYDMLKK